MERMQDQTLAVAIRAIGSADFPVALSAFLAALAQFDNLIVILYRGQDNPSVLHREYKDPIVFTAMDSDYVTANYVLDPFYEMHVAGVASGIYRMFDIAPDRFRQTSYYKLYYDRTTLVDEVAALVRLPHGATITVCLGLDRTSERKFTRHELERLRSHVSVITTLIELNWQDLGQNVRKTSRSDPSTSERLRQQLANVKNIRLSPRQAEVALLILQGHSSGSIALNLDISANTVKVFRKQLYARCKLSSQAELFATILPLLSNPSANPLSD